MFHMYGVYVCFIRVEYTWFCKPFTVWLFLDFEGVPDRISGRNCFISAVSYIMKAFLICHLRDHEWYFIQGISCIMKVFHSGYPLQFEGVSYRVSPISPVLWTCFMQGISYFMKVFHTGYLLYFEGLSCRAFPVSSVLWRCFMQATS